jgi:hypothetical protein
LGLVFWVCRQVYMVDNLMCWGLVVISHFGGSKWFEAGCEQFAVFSTI